MCLQHLHTDEAPLLVYVGHSDSWLFGAYYLPEDNIGADIKRNRFEFWIHGLLAFWPKLSFPHSNMAQFSHENKISVREVSL